MKFESLDESMFQQISQEQMVTIQGGSAGGTTLTCIFATGSCGCTDSSDVD